ncbi:hypothetical protein [Paenibacillus hexagrammi]|uniref:Uncharacterized protein n=1 Tax=Paenibacillus hexagrammi TaxID=2908839 RepID=A0ABY3SFX6_9BACL|nr:hypothetical protein [Paenibacillus sp. YPD9-1]UJF32345.1 hypothetical protein L0M14_21955 [Paenibacillus sp. YPD9-1]
MNELNELQTALSDARWVYWYQHVFLSWQWLLLLLFTAVLTLVWVMAVDRIRLLAIVFFGSCIFIASLIADSLGGELQLWDYPSMLLPWGPRIICIDWSIAIFSMMIYQLFTNWLLFLGAAICLSAFFSFILEPLASVWDIYQLYAWEYLYSFPIYILLFLLVKAITDKIAAVQKQHSH